MFALRFFRGVVLLCALCVPLVFAVLCGSPAHASVENHVPQVLLKYKHAPLYKHLLWACGVVVCFFLLFLSSVTSHIRATQMKDRSISEFSDADVFQCAEGATGETSIKENSPVDEQ